MSTAGSELSRGNDPRCRGEHWKVVSIASSLALLVLAIYEPTRQFPFVSLDDPLYVSNNSMVQQGLTAESIQWAFTTFHSANWHPVTWLSHMLDCTLFGPGASGMHHTVNLALHATNAILLFLLLRSMTGALWRSAAVALLFAAHPLRVESVAWVSERKDVLSTALGLLAIMTWVRWTRRGGGWRYLLALGLMGSSLMAKPMLVTLPGILLLLDVWPLQRIRLRAPPRDILRRVGRLILEKTPFVALSLAGSVVTMVAQQPAPFAEVPPVTRLAIAVTGVVEYLRITFWPHGLAPLYPLYRPSLWQWLGSLALVGIITVIALAGWRVRGWLMVGWLWFLGTLVPVIGLVRVGSQSTADRYTYVPSIGLLIGLIWLAAEALHQTFGRRLGDRIGSALVVAAALTLAIIARTQVWVWSDSVVLYRHAIAVTRPNWFMHNLLAAELAYRGDLAGAGSHFRESLRIYPRQPDVLSNLAALLVTDPDAARRDGAEAVRLAERAQQLSPKPEAKVLDTLAAAYAEVGRFDDAVRTAERALRAANDAGRGDLATRIARTIPEYRAGRSSHRLHFEGAAPSAQSQRRP